MKKVLVTGATGLLGKELVWLMQDKDYKVLIAGRKDPKWTEVAYQWQAFDLLEGHARIDLRGVESLFHLASSPFRKSYEVDVKGTEKLLQAAKDQGVAHFIYISIVGVDRLPIKYFRIKKQVEEMVQASGLAYSILRSTQFFEFFEAEVIKYQKRPLNFLPGATLYQPIETKRVAKKLIELEQRGGQNRLLEIGGSEVIRLDKALDIWLKNNGKSKWKINIPLSVLGKLGRELKNGALTTASKEPRSLRWEEWLKRKEWG